LTPNLVAKISQFPLKKREKNEAKDSIGYQSYMEEWQNVRRIQWNLSALIERFQLEGDELKRELKSLTGKATVVSPSRAGSRASNSGNRTPVMSPLRPSAPTNPMRSPVFEETKTANQQDTNLLNPLATPAIIPPIEHPDPPAAPPASTFVPIRPVVNREAFNAAVAQRTVQRTAAALRGTHL
jgi:hypothetical protein